MRKTIQGLFAVIAMAVFATLAFQGISLASEHSEMLYNSVDPGMMYDSISPGILHDSVHPDMPYNMMYN